MKVASEEAGGTGWWKKYALKRNFELVNRCLYKKNKELYTHIGLTCQNAMSDVGYVVNSLAFVGNLIGVCVNTRGKVMENGWMDLEKCLVEGMRE